jgi:hypothetical protein
MIGFFLFCDYAVFRSATNDSLWTCYNNGCRVLLVLDNQNFLFFEDFCQFLVCLLYVIDQPFHGIFQLSDTNIVYLEVSVLEKGYFVSDFTLEQESSEKVTNYFFFHGPTPSDNFKHAFIFS